LRFEFEGSNHSVKLVEARLEGGRAHGSRVLLKYFVDAAFRRCLMAVLAKQLSECRTRNVTPQQDKEPTIVTTAFEIVSEFLSAHIGTAPGTVLCEAAYPAQSAPAFSFNEFWLGPKVKPTTPIHRVGQFFDICTFPMSANCCLDCRHALVLFEDLLVGGDRPDAKLKIAVIDGQMRWPRVQVVLAILIYVQRRDREIFTARERAKINHYLIPLDTRIGPRVIVRKEVESYVSSDLPRRV